MTIFVQIFPELLSNWSYLEESVESSVCPRSEEASNSWKWEGSAKDLHSELCEHGADTIQRQDKPLKNMRARLPKAFPQALQDNSSSSPGHWRGT